VEAAVVDVQAPVCAIQNRRINKYLQAVYKELILYKKGGLTVMV